MGSFPRPSSSGHRGDPGVRGRGGPPVAASAAAAVFRGAQAEMGAGPGGLYGDRLL